MWPFLKKLKWEEERDRVIAKGGHGVERGIFRRESVERCSGDIKVTVKRSSTELSKAE